jgi:plastocyanin
MDGLSISISRVHLVVLLTATVAATIGLPAKADDADVLQIKQAFDPGAYETKVGAAVVFLNADDVNHNLQRVAPDGVKTDFGVEKPGESTKIVFESAGVYSIICAIHPRMKMKVTVR